MNDYHVIITPRASRDLDSIHAHIAKDSPLNADAMAKRILDALEPLSSFPHRAVVVGQGTNLREPMRRLPVWPYVVYFRVVERKKLVEISHIRHGARRPPTRFT
jgi:toxin ParE1/3/4